MSSQVLSSSTRALLFSWRTARCSLPHLARIDFSIANTAIRAKVFAGAQFVSPGSIATSTCGKWAGRRAAIDAASLARGSRGRRILHGFAPSSARPNWSSSASPKSPVSSRRAMSSSHLCTTAAQRIFWSEVCKVLNNICHEKTSPLIGTTSLCTPSRGPTKPIRCTGGQQVCLRASGRMCRSPDHFNGQRGGRT